MNRHKKRIGIIIYANPDYYPPVLNTIQILAKEFDLVIICRNQDKKQFTYPDNVRLYRLGRFMTPRQKELQPWIMKILEYIVFVIRAVFYIRRHNCRLIYSYDMHGFIAGLLSSRLGKKIILIYHNLELIELNKQKSLSYMIKYLELRFIHYADKIVFADINRARFFRKEAKLAKLPEIVMNAPLRQEEILPNKLQGLLKTKGFGNAFKVVLFQGRINEAYSILEIVESMVLWPEDCILVLLGWVTSTFLGKIYNLAGNLNISNRIIYLPQIIPYPELLSYTCGADLGLALIKPFNINLSLTFSAGACNKLFEYLSLGIPAIVTDSPYFREVLDPAMVYFAKPDCIEDIARAVNSAFSDTEEYARKSQSARLAHLTNLNWGEQFKPILGYIRQITGRRNS